MNKKEIAILMFAAGILAASCHKQTEPEVKPMTIIAVSESIGTAAKTEMAYKCDILWSKDDRIYVTKGTASDTFILSDGAGTTKGTFTQDGTTSFTGEVRAYYPAAMVQDGGLVWPATQTNNQTVPMYSTKTVSSNVEEFNFSSLGSVLQIVFTTAQPDVTLQSIEIKDAKETMSGAYTVDTDGKANIIATDNAGITLNLGDGVNVSNNIAYFNIAVPAGNYQDLTLTFIATDGAKCVMKNVKVNIDHNIVARLTLTGKEFTATTGKTTATIDGKDAEVNWVQLWDKGPKFAERNIDGTMTFTDAIMTGSGYLWGANWHTPSKDELNELLLAAQGNSESKVTCKYEQVNSVWGFNFTGKEDDYTENSVFFPVQVGSSSSGWANYWSSTANGDSGWEMVLSYSNGHWNSAWESNYQNVKVLVRPVQVNEK